MLDAVKVYRVAVSDMGAEVIFLHTVEPGGTDRSYGIHVAGLAGVPSDIIERARGILDTLEESHLAIPTDTERGAGPVRFKAMRKGSQLSLFAPVPDPVVAKLDSIELDAVTPAAALELLAEVKRLAAES